ncbi:MAG: tetratricopeptide repeat protein [Flavobacteriales bacterium]|nr:tetratricopeptide repeat protein [Flavobacteriales bacterium]
MHAMQGPFTLCLSVLVCGALLAQSEERQRKVDSLQQVLGSALHDTDSVSTLIAISSLVTGDERMGYARAALRIADRGLPGSKGERRGALLRGLGGACSGIGSRLRQLGQRDSAIFYYQRGLEAAREAEDPATEANLLNGLGVVLYQSGNIDSALVLMEKSLAIREATGDSATLAASCVNIASMHHARGNIPMALEMYVKARDLAERRKDMPAYATVLVNIGALHEGQHELDSALAYYRRALGPLKELNNTEGLALAYNNMGTVYLTLKEYDRALESVRNGIPPAVRGRHHNALSDLYFKQSRILEEQGDLSGAIIECDRSILYADSASSPRGAAYGHIQRAKITRLMGDARSALRYALLSVDKAAGLDELYLKKDRAQELSHIYEALGDDRNAFAQYRLFTQLSDSITNEKNRKDLIRNGFKYEYGKREAVLMAEQEKQDALADKELQKQKLVRNGFMGGFGLVALFASVFFVQRNRISKARKRSDELLLNILPEEVAEELKDTGTAAAKHFEQATILFTDFKGFTEASERMSPQELVEELNTCFKAFDGIITTRGIEKIKTIGDAYMCAGGLPVPTSSTPAGVVQAALEMQAFMKRHKAEREAQGKPAFEMRADIHTGPVVAGIVGVKKFAYDIWGDTVNTASRMESSGEVGQVNISEATYALVKHETGLTFSPRGKVQAKGKGEMEMYFVTTGD